VAGKEGLGKRGSAQEGVSTAHECVGGSSGPQQHDVGMRGEWGEEKEGGGEGKRTSGRG
jgi:hypothetical protein